MSFKARRRVATIRPRSDDRPELFFGLVAPVGAPLSFFTSILEGALEEKGYDVEPIHVSKFLEDSLRLDVVETPVGSSEFQRLFRLMERGNALRKRAERSDVLAMMTAATIFEGRPRRAPLHHSGRAFIIRQLKHPEEVHYLRSVYGDAFHLIGLYCPAERRKDHLTVVRGMKESEAQQLIDKDEGEDAEWGQHLRDAFHLADVFIEYRGAEDTRDVQAETSRFVDLLFGATDISPKKDEFGMFLARSTALRSADLSRQVGATVLNQDGDVLAVGTNEVPSVGGGQYWEGDPQDDRDIKRGYDSNEAEQYRILREILATIEPDWSKLASQERERRVNDCAKQLRGTRVANLTEFGRAVHAEMAAITSAARNGIGIRGATLYCTTFPCHNCAKHIVAVGLKRVVYIEPYPKSMAKDLHSDAIDVECESNSNKVCFESFVGIAPRRFGDLFSMITPEGKRLKRKGQQGILRKEPWDIRVRERPITYVQREMLAAEAINILIPESE